MNLEKRISTQTQQTVKAIAALLPDANCMDEETIQFYLLYHECEPSAAAERISGELGLDYSQVYALMP